MAVVALAAVLALALEAAFAVTAAAAANVMKDDGGMEGVLTWKLLRLGYVICHHSEIIFAN